MELKPEVNYLHGHEIADARARRMARDNATLVARMQQSMDTMQQAHTDFSASVNAALAEIPDIVNGMRHYVTPQDFGAVGDGIADDSDAMQAALDSGHDIYVPCMRREKYLITRTLNVTSFNQLIFADSDYLNWASTNVTTEGTDGGFVFRADEPSAPLFLVTGGMVAFSNLNIICANRHKGIAIAYNKGEDQTNVDGSVIRCYIKNFETAISYSGRGLAVKDCFFYYNNTDVYTHMPADDAWKTDGSDTPTYQTHPNHAGRGYRMEGNRHHLTQGTMYSFAGDTTEKDGVSYTYGVKGALIANNSCDLGIGYFVRFNCPVYDSIITNNHVNRCSAENIIQSSHPLTRTVIANNTFSGLIEGALHYCPKNAIYVKAFDDCTINANVFTNIEGMCISTWYSGYTNHTSITANVFTNVGFDTSISAAADRAAVPMSDANGVTITGNVFNISAPFAGCAVSRKAYSAKTWMDVIVQDNVIPDASAILIPTGAAAVRVDVQGAEGSKGSDLLETMYSDTLAWDGKTEGLLPAFEVEGAGIYKASDVIPDKAHLEAARVFLIEYDSRFDSAEPTEVPADACPIIEFNGGYGIAAYAFVATIEGATLNMEGMEVTFPEPGLYLPVFTGTNEDVTAGESWTTRGYTCKLILPGFNQFPVHTLKGELLPETGSGAFVATITGTVDEGSETVVWSIDKTFAEIVEALKAGKAVSANMVLPFGDATVYQSNGYIFGMTADGGGEINIGFTVINASHEGAELMPFGRFTLNHSNALTCDVLNMG